MNPIPLGLTALAKGCVCGAISCSVVWVLGTWAVNLEDFQLLVLMVSVLVAMVACVGGVILAALFGVPAYFVLHHLRCANLPIVALAGGLGGWWLNVSMGFMNTDFEFLGHAAPGAIIIIAASAALMVGLHFGVLSHRNGGASDDFKDFRGIILEG